MQLREFGFPVSPRVDVARGQVEEPTTPGREVIAGMQPFKPYFLGEAPAPYPRATSIQKCVRTGDIDEVGKTTRHNTFFQMAGNFSFGDYFKQGAIEHAWQLVTGSQAEGGYGFDPDRIWVTVYRSDDEAAERLYRRSGADQVLRDLNSVCGVAVTTTEWADSPMAFTAATA